MTIADAFRRLARAFKAGIDAAGSKRSSRGVEWETSANDEVILCESNHPEARLIAVASLYGCVQVRVCQKNMSQEDFRASFPMAYTYGPGGSERSGTDVGISFTTDDDLLERLQDDKEYDERRSADYKRLPRVKTTETTFLWAVVNSKSRHFQFPAKQ